MTHGEMPPTWLGKIIEECRRIEYRFRPFKERREEHSCILSKIEKHPKGAPLAANEDLSTAIYGALDKADAVEKEIAANPQLATGSPHEQAALYIAERLDMTLVLQGE
jgi:hypothetical protein